MTKRMVIQRYVPPAAETERSDGLPPLPPFPPRDGQYQWTFVGRRSMADAWGSESLALFARLYARTCCAALDLEIDALKVERDALKAELDEIRRHDSR